MNGPNPINCLMFGLISFKNRSVPASPSKGEQIREVYLPAAGPIPIRP